MTERGRGVDRRKHFAPRCLDVGLEPLDLAVRGLVRLRFGRERGGGAIALDLRVGGGGPPAGQRGARRFPPALDGVHLAGQRRHADPKCLHLLAVELDLLLLPVDRQLARVRRLARARRARLGFDELDAQTSEVAVELGHMGRRQRLALARRGQPCARRFDRFRELPVLAREQDLFPSPQLVAQPLVAARLRRLPLQRPALLLDLEHDVVDAREVLAGGLQLELGRAAARLVLRDPGRLLEQLPAIRRPRAENHSDLALLDDGVGLGAQPRVHQQVVHVAQPAHAAVDQVLALARSVQPPRDLDLARHGSNDLLHHVGAMAVAVSRAMTICRDDRCRSRWRAERLRPPRPSAAVLRTPDR